MCAGAAHKAVSGSSNVVAWMPDSLRVNPLAGRTNQFIAYALGIASNLPKRGFINMARWNDHRAA
jgi:hypothetical protein